jgi:hypothetical protein
MGCSALAASIPTVQRRFRYSETSTSVTHRFSSPRERMSQRLHSLATVDLRDLNNQRVTKEALTDTTQTGTSTSFRTWKSSIPPSITRKSVRTRSTTRHGKEFFPRERRSQTALHTRNTNTRRTSFSKSMRTKRNFAGHRIESGWHWAFTDNAKYGPVRIWRAVMALLG